MNPHRNDAAEHVTIRITFKLYASLGVHLPSTARNNALKIEVKTGATTYDIVDRYAVPRESVHLVLVNGVYVPPQERDTAVLKDGDTLAIWPPVAGG